MIEKKKKKKRKQKDGNESSLPICKLQPKDNTS